MAQRNRGFARSTLEVMHPDAAGIDVGGSMHFVAVRSDVTEQPVRQFGGFTDQLHAIADWLLECGVGSSQWNPLACTSVCARRRGG